MAKSSKSSSTKKSAGHKSDPKSTAKVIKIEKANDKSATKSTGTKGPRIRKVESVRERNKKTAKKAEAKANKQQKRYRIKSVASKAAKPLNKPAKLISWPFRTKPARFVGRIIGRILWPKYFRNSWKEIKQVTWPSRKETWKLTLAVLIFALVFGLAAAGVDWILDKVIQRIVFRG